MTGSSFANRFDRTKFAKAADYLAVAVAVSLPWSTSATSILLAIWLLALIPALDWADLRAELMTAAGGLPVLLFAAGAVGVLWADVSWHEAWKGLDSFVKFLTIPLLIVQFRRSDRGWHVIVGYALSCGVLLVFSCGLALWYEQLILLSNDPGVPVKNAATQSGEFVTCFFGLLFLAYDLAARRQWLWLAALTAVMAAILANIVFVATGRTALVLIPVLLALFAVKKLSARGIVALAAAAIAVGAVAWFSSAYLRERTEVIWSDLRNYEVSNARNSAGERVEFARKSIEFIREAPFIGHGTGTIHALFVKASAGRTGAAGVAASNPHNQTFAVAIQLGLFGVVILWAMWTAHLWLFRGSGLIQWIGLVVVVQNIVGSLFNSHLFDFMQGWVYVLGVGVAGGMALKQRAQRT